MVFTFYAWVARSRSGFSSFSALALNKPTGIYIYIYIFCADAMVTNGPFAIWPDEFLRKRSFKVVLRLGGYAYAGPVRSALRDSVLCLPTDSHSLRVNKLPHPPPSPL